MGFGKTWLQNDEIPLAVRLTAGDVLVGRFQALTARGYRPVLGEVGAGGITLHHAGKAPPIQIWGDGQVLDEFPDPHASDEDRIVINADDGSEFERFVQSIRAPSIVQRLPHVTLRDLADLFIALAVLAGIVWAMRRLVDSLT
jgi:hypothetical protein